MDIEVILELTHLRCEVCPAQNTLIQQMGKSVQWEYILKMLKVIHGFSAGYIPLTYHSVWGRFLLLSPTEP